MQQFMQNPAYMPQAQPQMFPNQQPQMQAQQYIQQNQPQVHSMNQMAPAQQNPNQQNGKSGNQPEKEKAAESKGNEEEEGLDEIDQEVRGRRRSKNDVEGRDHRCKYCDKTYLSYPALYTHTKQKHSTGPDGEQRAPPTSGRGRGRPRKNVGQLIFHFFFRPTKGRTPSRTSTFTRTRGKEAQLTLFMDLLSSTRKSSRTATMARK